MQTLSLIKVDNIHVCEEGFEIRIIDRIKTSGIHSIQPVLQIPRFSEKPSICVAEILSVYLERTQDLRKLSPEFVRLFLTFKKPIHEASSATLSRWVKSVLEDRHFLIFGIQY